MGFNNDIDDLDLEQIDSGRGVWDDESSATHYEQDRIDIGAICQNGRPILAIRASDGPGFGDALWGPSADDVFRRR